MPNTPSPIVGQPPTPPTPSARRPIEAHVAALVLMALVLITLVNVLVRYFTSQSFAWTEEISVFLLVVLTLAGGAVAAWRDAHIRIEFFYARARGPWRRALVVLTAICTVVLFALLALLMARSGLQEFEFGETTTGLGVPRWWYTVWLPPLAALLAWRALRQAWQQLRAPDAERVQDGAP